MNTKPKVRSEKGAFKKVKSRIVEELAKEVASGGGKGAGPACYNKYHYTKDCT